MFDPHNHDWWLTTLLLVILAMWAGFVSYLRTLVKGQEFRWLWFASHMSSSALAGLITALLCDQYEVTIQWTGIACALAGHMSAEAVKVFEDRMRKKAEAMEV